MFTGIIEATATVDALVPNGPHLLTLRISGPSWLGDLQLGASVAVAGVCLTVTEADGAQGTASFEVMSETLALTSLGRLSAGDRVNVERALAAGGRLDGHVVQGHVDATGTLISRRDLPGDTHLQVRLPASLAPLVALKGSIALDGVSLTISGVSEPGSEECFVRVSLIPATIEATTLDRLAVGDRLNVEVDVLARYAARLGQFTQAEGQLATGVADQAPVEAAPAEVDVASPAHAGSAGVAPELLSAATVGARA